MKVAADGRILTTPTMERLDPETGAVRGTYRAVEVTRKVASALVWVTWDTGYVTPLPVSKCSDELLAMAVPS